MRVGRFRPSSWYFSRDWTQNLLIGLSVKLVSTGINERIDHRRGPRKHRSYYVQNWDFYFIVDHIDQHKRHKTQKEAQKYSQHQSGHSRVLPSLKPSCFSSVRTGMCFQIFSTLPHPPIDAKIRDTYHNAWHDES